MSTVSSFSIAGNPSSTDTSSVSWQCRRVGPPVLVPPDRHASMPFWIPTYAPPTAQAPVLDHDDSWFETLCSRLHSVFELLSTKTPEKMSDGEPEENRQTDHRTGDEMTSDGQTSDGQTTSKATPCHEPSHAQHGSAAKGSRRSRRVYNIADIW